MAKKSKIAKNEQRKVIYMRRDQILDGLDLHAMTERQFAGGHLQRIGPEIAGGGIDEVAGERGCLDEARDFGRVAALDIVEFDGAPRLAVAVEAIGTETKAQRRDRRVTQRAGEPIAARLQRGRVLTNDRKVICTGPSQGCLRIR